MMEHHTGYGSRSLIRLSNASGVLKETDTIAVYSFALKPEEHQYSSGTCILPLELTMPN